MNKTIQAAGIEIAILNNKNYGDYLSLTDIAKFKTVETSGYVIQNWMRNKNTICFLALWEKFHNADFNCLEFEAIEREAGLNSFVLTPKRWIEQTQALGIQTKQGRYAVTYARIKISHLSSPLGYLQNSNYTLLWNSNVLSLKNNNYLAGLPRENWQR